jgi:hypothetical protein
MKRFFAAALAAFTLLCVQAGAQTTMPPFARQAGEFVASRYIWDYGQVRTTNAVGATTGTIILNASSVTLRDGSTLYPFAVTAPLTIDQGSAVSETFIPTTVSGCTSNTPNATCSITGTFVNAHGPSASITSGTFGLQEAINDAAGFNGAGLISAAGGMVTVDKSWPGTTSQIAGTATGNAAGSAPQGNVTVFPNVTVVDKRNGSIVYWNAQGGATTLAAPTTLVNTTTVGITVNGAAATGGFYTNAAAYFVCIAYVDLAGQEGPCSGTMSFTPASGTTNQIGFTAPAASAGAVGWVPYISLTAGSYVLAYKVPLVTQPTVVGTYPVGNGVCTLTTLETTTPACAVANTAYGQTGAGAVVSALTLSTSPIDPQVTTISSTTVYTPNAGGRTTYSYVPGSHIGTPGVITGTLPFTIGAAAATIVPDVVGTINIAPNFMNVVGKTLEICGEATTTATTATNEDIQFQWDAMGQNTAGKGVLIGDLAVTNTLATTGHLAFCADFQTTVASAGATGGSINHVGGFVTSAGVTTAAAAGGGDVVTPGATGLLNLAVDARINVIYLHTTLTDGAGWILQNLTAKLI